VAGRQVEVAELQLESGKMSVEAELVRRFVPVLSARRRIDLVDSLLEVSSSSVQAIRRRVEAGAAMEIDVMRAELERSELALERAELERSLAENEARLGELWGERVLGLDGVHGFLPGILEIPTLEELTVAMEGHPASQLLDAERLAIQAEIDEARAEGSPELALSAGYLRNNELEEETVIAGVSLSLPVFDRNKGAVAEKHHEMTAAEHQARLERIERSTALTTLYSEIEGTGMELRVLSGELLPKATRIHDTLDEFYVQGKTGILDVLEARSHLLELQMRVVDLVEQQALLGADLVELTGYQIAIIR
jgi:cobalt-zinc-cadmium efflux system outer membrane protein